MSTEMSSGVSDSDAQATEAATREVVCPECGQSARVTLNRRSATDFCARCDFPLFWIPSHVLLEDRGASDSLRRMPGAVGRRSVGTAACPQCAEQNLLTVDNCIRCGALMRPTVSIPAPVPAVPPPAPEPEPVMVEPPRSRAWIWIVGTVLAAFLVVLALVLYLQQRG